MNWLYWTPFFFKKYILSLLIHLHSAISKLHSYGRNMQLCVTFNKNAIKVEC